MLYKEYGTIGKKVSAVGFGGMRFDMTEQDAKLEQNAALVRYAFDKGITYFDTAPGYCWDRSEAITGEGLKGIVRDRFTLSTKCGLWNAKTADNLRKMLEQSLTRLKVDYLDIYNMWSLKNMDDYAEYMKKGGVYEGMVKAREEGLIKHICLTAHMNSGDLAAVADTGLFQGITVGYNAINFAYRQSGIDACIAKRMGVVTMNPLGGGIIPRHPDHFSFIRRGTEDSVAVAALKFIVSQPGITVALVGFNNTAEVDEALLATERLYDVTPSYIAEQSAFLQENLNALCTTCAYCDECPAGLPVPKLMDTYNQYILSGDVKSIGGFARGFWDLDAAAEAAKCVECGKCEGLCTQKLPIMERLRLIRDGE